MMFLLCTGSDAVRQVQHGQAGVHESEVKRRSGAPCPHCAAAALRLAQ